MNEPAQDFSNVELLFEGCVPPTPEPMPAVVNMLRDILHRAKAGEVVSISVIAVNRAGNVWPQYAGAGDMAFTLLGGMRIAERRFMDECWPAYDVSPLSAS